MNSDVVVVVDDGVAVEGVLEGVIAGVTKASTVVVIPVDNTNTET